MVENTRQTSIVVGTTSVLVSEAQIGDTQRKVLVLTNTSAGGQTITLSFGDEAVANNGIVLYPTGAWSESLDSAYTPSNDRIFAIASAAAGQISVYERVMSGERFLRRG
jgi:hypothetical protein